MAELKKKRTRKKKVEETPCLSNEEMLTLKWHNEQFKVASLEEKLLGKEIEIISYKKALFQEKLLVANKELQLIEASQLKNAEEKRKIQSTSKAVNEHIKTRLGIKSKKWGYNPDTGEVIE